MGSARARDEVLGVIDAQPCFMPGGELPVPNGDAVLAPINRLLDGRYCAAFATQDWHPPGHHSFASAHPGRAAFETIGLPYGPQVLWPDHAIAGSAGAELHPALDQRRLRAVFRKGMDPAIDSYSGFFENDRATPTGLAGWLAAIGARHLFLAGLAADFCVAWTAEDARRLGFSVTVIEDACRAIAMPLPGGGTSGEAARARLGAMGVAFARAGDL